jgi:peroxiredoxin
VDSRRRGSLVLLLIAGLAAAGAGAWVALSRGTSHPLRPGALAPGFELPALSGGSEALSGYRGRVLFVNFWATWCTPCREEAPALQILYERLRDAGFSVLAISIDDAGARDKVEAFARTLELDFPILLDPDQAVYHAYQAYGVPETFVVDRQGRVVERFVGPKAWADPRYERAIRSLLEAPPGAIPTSGGEASRG